MRGERAREREPSAPTLDAGTGAFLTQATLGETPDTVTALAIGSSINGRYTVRRSIARGGMGWVYEVADALNPERAVALKIVPGIGSSPVKLSLFKAEFATMTQLDHPNVARVYDFEQIQGTDDFLITMERIDGAPLTRGSDGWKSAIEPIVQVCRALAYVHSRRIVHFDLKPANILVDTSGQVKVVDFGIAGAEPLGRDGRMMGTPQYMPPELLLGGGSGVDHRADLYSLGITLYQLLVGELPCVERELYLLIAWLNQSGVQVPAQVDAPAWLKKLVARLCAKDPADRPRNANAVVREINTAGGFDYQLETAETRQSYVMTPRFSGRAAEYDRISGFVSQRLNGDGGREALLLSGVSGIGKSRLMREVRQAAQLQRLAFLEGNCYERSFVEYGPIADLLHQLVPLVETLGGIDTVQAALPELVKLAPKLAQGRSFMESPKAATAEGERARLYETTTTFLLQAAKCIPFAFYLNDLQWAARGTAQLFFLLAQRLRDEEARGQTVKLALIGSYRSDEVEGRPLAEGVRVLSEEKVAETIDLSPLGPAEVKEVITSMLGVEDVPNEFLGRITQETVGNPFFVQEVMRVLFDNGTIFLDVEGRWATKDEVGALDIPHSMAEVFRRRFVQLGPDEQEIVRTLAVHGRPMPLELLGAVLGEVTAAMNALVKLEDKAIVDKQAGRELTYNIAHDRMRETIYADLPDAERRRLHRSIADKLEAGTAHVEEQQKPLDELARHFREGHLEDKALDYARRAGKRAFATYANDAAVEHLLYAHEVNERRKTPDLEVLELLAEALLRKGEAPQGARILTEAVPLCSTAIERSRVHAKLGLCRVGAEGAIGAGIEGCERALEELGVRTPRTRIGLALALLRDLGWLVRKKTFAKGDGVVDRRCRELCTGYSLLAASLINQNTQPFLILHATLRAARFGERAGALAERALSRGLVGLLLAWAGHLTTAKRWFEAAGEDAILNHNLEVQVAIAYGVFGIIGGHGACSPEQLPELQIGVQKARLSGTFLLGASIANVQHEGIRIGAWKQTVDTWRSVSLYIKRFAPSFKIDETVSSHAPLSLLHASGSPAEAIEVGERVLVHSRQRNQGLAEQAANDSLADALLAAGDLRGAIRSLEASLDLATKGSGYLCTREVFRLLPRLYLQENPSERGAQRKAAGVIAKGRRLVKKGHEDKRPLVELSEAILFEAQGKQKRADAKFEQALQTARGQGARFYVYDVLLQRGLMLKKRGDRANAKRDLDEARALAVACADKYVTKLCDDALPRL
jgi:tetratricopeptide (TPR) repeat protein